MSDTTDLLDAPASGAGDTSCRRASKAPRKRAAGLSGMVLAELQGLAGELGIGGRRQDAQGPADRGHQGAPVGRLGDAPRADGTRPAPADPRHLRPAHGAAADEATAAAAAPRREAPSAASGPSAP